jgi:hypothetical protein
LTSSIEWNWCKASSSLPSSCRDDTLTVLTVKKGSSRSEMTRFSTTPPMKSRRQDTRSIDYVVVSGGGIQYDVTINNFHNFDDDSYSRQASVVIFVTMMTVKTHINDYLMPPHYAALHSTTIIIISLASLRARALRSTLVHVHPLAACCLLLVACCLLLFLLSTLHCHLRWQKWLVLRRRTTTSSKRNKRMGMTTTHWTK